MLGLLVEFRKALAEEVSSGSSLPRDLESQVFSYLDQLVETRRAHSAVRAQGKKADDAFDILEPEDNAAENAGSI